MCCAVLVVLMLCVSLWMVSCISSEILWVYLVIFPSFTSLCSLSFVSLPSLLALLVLSPSLPLFFPFLCIGWSSWKYFRDHSLLLGLHRLPSTQARQASPRSYQTIHRNSHLAGLWSLSLHRQFCPHWRVSLWYCSQWNCCSLPGT